MSVVRSTVGTWHSRNPNEKRSCPNPTSRLCRWRPSPAGRH
ncbi:hypothetical protein KTR9_3126 [Gordonia sp. KTR9]|nr:hypothetical protein KTR9_3126 [Gordonia sp. KTR9]